MRQLTPELFRVFLCRILISHKVPDYLIMPEYAIKMYKNYERNV